MATYFPTCYLYLVWMSKTSIFNESFQILIKNLVLWNVVNLSQLCLVHDTFCHSILLHVSLAIRQPANPTRTCASTGISTCSIIIGDWLFIEILEMLYFTCSGFKIVHRYLWMKYNTSVSFRDTYTQSRAHLLSEVHKPF